MSPVAVKQISKWTGRAAATRIWEQDYDRCCCHHDLVEMEIRWKVTYPVEVAKTKKLVLGYIDRFGRLRCGCAGFRQTGAWRGYE
jgi:hypothetical protein